jgi:hypothetical protein
MYPENEGISMRDWLSASSLYVPAWVLAGTVMGIFGPHSIVGIIIWLSVGLVIALFAWSASAAQTKQSREIHENLGKLVSVTESSPTNVIAAVAAKILDLETRVKSFADVQRFLEKHRSTNWIPMDEAEKRTLTGDIQGLGKHSVCIQHTGQSDCYEFAIDLHETFRRADWIVAPLVPEAINSPVRSIVVLGRDRELVTKMTSTLLPVTRAPKAAQPIYTRGARTSLYKLAPGECVRGIIDES